MTATRRKFFPLLGGLAALLINVHKWGTYVCPRCGDRVELERLKAPGVPGGKCKKCIAQLKAEFPQIAGTWDRNNTAWPHLFAVVLLLASAAQAQAANWFVRAAATGANTGLNWTDAFNTPLVNASQWAGFSAGDTFWIAGGGQFGLISYKSGVTIKRATAANPECTGTAGWSSAFDAQVVIGVGYLAGNAGFRFVPPYSDFITVDGQVANGIKFVLPIPGVDANTQTASQVFGILSAGNSNSFSNIEFAGPAGHISADIGISVNNAGGSSYNSHVYVGRCYFHDLGAGMFLGQTSYPTVEYCEFARSYGNTFNHDNCAYIFSSNHGIIRYNYVHDFGALGFYWASLDTVDDWQIYGNVIRNIAAGGQGMALDPSGGSASRYGSNWFICNNSFAKVAIGLRTTTTRFSPGNASTGGYVTNNIFYQAAADFGAMSHDYNLTDSAGYGEPHGIIGAPDPFVNLAADDMHIVSTIAANYPRAKGITVGLSLDKDGVSWLNPPSIGAYEYPGAGSPGSLQVSTAAATVSEGAGTITITLQRIGGSVGAVGCSYATADGTAAAGVNYTSASGTKSWANADAADKTFTIPLSNTGMTGNKTLALNLSAPTGGATLGTATETITLAGTGSSSPCLLAGLSWEAESACSITTPLIKGTNSATVYIYQPSQTTDYTLAGKAVYTFTNSAGGYRIRTSINASSDASNSFFVGTNNAAPDICDIVTLTSGFETRYVSLRGSGTFDNPQYPDAVFTLPAGTNTITIYGREANTLLDSLTLEPVIVNLPPVVTSLSTTLTNLATYVAAYASAGSNVPITLTWSTNVTATGSPYLQLDSGGKAPLTSGSGTSNLLFTCAVGAFENSQALNATSIVLNGGTLRNGGMDATLTLPTPGGAGSLQAQQRVVVDTVKPVTSIDSPNTILALAGSSVTFLIKYSDLNLPRSALGPSASDVTINGTATAAKTVSSGMSPSNATVTLSSLTTGTLTISIAAGTATDLAGNPSTAAGPSETVTVYNGAHGQVITTKAGTVVSHRTPP